MRFSRVWMRFSRVWVRFSRREVEIKPSGWDLAKCGWDLAGSWWDIAECGWDLTEGIWELAEQWVRFSRVVRASGCQCQSRTGPEVDPSIFRHRGIWGAADEAVLNNEHKRTIPKNPPFCEELRLVYPHLWLKANILGRGMKKKWISSICRTILLRSSKRKNWSRNRIDE
jgi:hypothetical protein